MSKIRTKDGKKNIIGSLLIQLRKERSLSQRDLATLLQLAGYNLDKNVITRIETYQRYVSDLELKGLCEVLNVSADYLLGIEEKNS